MTLVDDTPPCESPDARPRATRRHPCSPGQTWNYQCGPVTPTDRRHQHRRPSRHRRSTRPTGNQPFPAPEPVGHGDRQGRGRRRQPGHRPDQVGRRPTVVVIGPDGEPRAGHLHVRGHQHRGRPAQPARRVQPAARDRRTPAGSSTTPCSPVTYVSGDDDDNDLLDPGETWTFTCPGSGRRADAEHRRDHRPAVGRRTARRCPCRPVDRRGLGVRRRRDRPDIDVVKTALVPVVLDPGADAGRSARTSRRRRPRPAEYLYEVTNTGNVPLDLDPDPPTDDICSPLVFVPASDTNGDGLLDVDETWIYTCATQLDRDDANTPPDPGDDVRPGDEHRSTVIGVPFFDGAVVPGQVGHRDRHRPGARHRARHHDHQDRVRARSCSSTAT